jgi:ubiquinone/menaquinone biosynthesis C-methylase UbiE
MIEDPLLAEVLRCPSCQGTIKQNRCINCTVSFTDTLGIIDLRWPQADYSDHLDPRKQREDKIIKRIVKHYDTATFEELIQFTFDIIGVPRGAPEELIELFQTYRSEQNFRGDQMLSMFRESIERHFTLPNEFLALDIGCGVGPSTFSLAKQFQWVIGFDPTMSNLLLAKKYCEENSYSNVRLIQAYAQNIPLQDNCISFAVAQNVIEHLHDVENAFKEINRVLISGGCFCGDSRNRYDLFFPEPHVNIRWLGYFPRSVQPRVVKRLRGLPYTSVHMLSLAELRHYSERVFSDSAVITFPHVSTYNRSNRWNMIVNLIGRIPIVRTIVLAIFPTHLLLACVK